MLITPIGIAIGVGVHDGFAANGRTALLSVGILNSISAGILVSNLSDFSRSRTQTHHSPILYSCTALSTSSPTTGLGVRSKRLPSAGS